MRPIRRAVGEWQLFTQICRCIRIAEGPEAAAKLSSPVCTAAAHLVTCRSLQNPQSLTIVDDATLHPRRLTDPAECSAFVLMEVETLGVARSLEWKVHMRCASGLPSGNQVYAGAASIGNSWISRRWFACVAQTFPSRGWTRASSVQPVEIEG
jgi:hypothetical protein